ncbi:MAG: hypothetical protein IKL34_07780 [Alistipes sp.]|nr:hypothetical protein [Alistipes sp.]
MKPTRNISPENLTTPLCVLRFSFDESRLRSKSGEVKRKSVPISNIGTKSNPKSRHAPM